MNKIVAGLEQAIETRPGCIGATIVTHGGTYFDFESPETSHIDIHDIAWALSMQTRYTGHTRTFYSIAQHSVMVSQIVPPACALAGLLHDAHEAYVGDMSSPLKQLCPDYRAIEKRCEAAVLNRFGVVMDAECKRWVKLADLRMLMTEKRDLTSATFHVWPGLDGIQPRVDRIEPWSQSRAYDNFMNRFVDLYRG